MKFGVLAGNSRINSLIYAKLEEIHPEDIATFVRKFKSERGVQLFHTLHELTMGAELRRRGVPVRYEQSVGAKTPDWSCRDTHGQVLEIFDVVALHQRKETETEMLTSLSSGQIWTGWISIPPDHIYSKVEQKVGAYSALVESLQLPFVVGLFGEFTASIDPEEMNYVLFAHHGGLFSQLPLLSALLYCYEESGTFNYELFVNPHSRYSSIAVASAFADGVTVG